MTRLWSSLLLFVFCTSLIVGAPARTQADAASDIQAKIDANNTQVAALQADIAAYQKQLDTIGATKSTLQSTINSLTLNQKKLASQIQLTQNKISSANLNIQKLTNSIGDKETSISANQTAIEKALRSVAEDEQSSLVTKLIATDSFKEAWQVADEAVQFNQALIQQINNLRTARTELASNRDAVAAQKADLISLQNDLSGQKRSVDASKAAQQQLLAQTKNQESNYQKLIAQKQASEQTLEQELTNLQGQLNLVVHPGLLPKVGSGVIGWPFNNAFMLSCARLKGALGNPFCVTQYFGNTTFATANPQIYHGNAHNGLDIGAPIGTPIYAALGGVVLGTGNTDLAHDPQGNQCWSFGKWIMIIHGNGLSTMYAHLSAIDVTKGQTVSARQMIGLSGMTGSATGPHIHFGVYATEGTKIMTLGQFKGTSGTRCAGATMPVATLDAYLNPLSYL